MSRFCLLEYVFLSEDAWNLTVFTIVHRTFRGGAYLQEQLGILDGTTVTLALIGYVMVAGSDLGGLGFDE